MWPVVFVAGLGLALVFFATTRLRALASAVPWSPALLLSFARRPPKLPLLLDELSRTGGPWSHLSGARDGTSPSDRNLWWMGWNQVLEEGRRWAEGAAKVMWCATGLCAFFPLQERLRLAALNLVPAAPVEIYVLVVGASAAVCCHALAAIARAEATELRGALRALVPPERTSTRLASRGASV